MIENHVVQTLPQGLKELLTQKSEVVSADESEIGIVSELEDDWYSCESSDDEDEYFYDAVSLVNSHDVLFKLSSPPGH